VYAASFGLVIVALITLIIGVFQSGLTFIWISIASSVAAALFLAVGVLQKKPVQPATAGAPYGPPAGSTEAVEERETAVLAAAPATRVSAARPSGDEEEAASPAPRTRVAARKKAPAKKAPAKRAPAKKAAAKATASKGAAKKSTAKAAASGGTVVAIPERGTYHQASCRFVKGRKDTERMTKASAGRKGFTACGVCRP
jgi:hypothetical protein